MTPEELKYICPTVSKPEDWAYLMSYVLESYGIDTPNRKAMFLAQCLHETGGFKFLKEIWGPTKWQLKYEGHKGLGNTQPGDGKKFLGRGLIQLTGRRNYTDFATWVKDMSILDNPDKVTDPGTALLTGIFYWEKNNLNRFADKDDIKGCTKAINGPGMLGLEERTHYYERGKEVFGKKPDNV